MRRRAVLLLTVMTVALLMVVSPAYAKTFTVNSTEDINDLDFPGGVFDGSSDGKCDVHPATTVDECTLRAAIQTANKLSGADTIAYNIPGSWVQTITPGSQLPTITQRLTIDGYTQSGATKNTIPLAKDGTNAVLKIELDGTNAGAGVDGLEIDASNVVVKGLVINNFSQGFGQGITLVGGTGHKVEGNFIGTDPSGTIKKGNTYGVLFSGTDGSTLGGTTPEARNLISGSQYMGVFVPSHGSGNRIQGNLIGTDKNGTADLGNGSAGVLVSSSSNTIGDSDPTDGLTNAANTIAFNDGGGVAIASSTQSSNPVSNGTRILSNSIFSNGELGIDLAAGGSFGVTANDPKDPDTGANRLQNYPLITSATNFPMGTSIRGTLNSTPSTRKKTRTFIIQFFSSPTADASGYGEGKTFLGQIQVKTDRAGNTGTFGFVPAQDVPLGHFVSATATNKKTGDTSEFSLARVVVEAGFE